jgi:anti-sigma factor RsiW
MNCEQVRETLPDLAAGLMKPSEQVREHLEGCAACAAQFGEFRQTMALLDEWEAPEPSPYFDTRLRARLNEEKAAEDARGRRWLAWLPRPALALAAVLAVAAGVGFWQHNATVTEDGVRVSRGVAQTTPSAERGTAVSDLQALDKDNDLYADFDVLDDIDSQQNSATATATN